MNEKNTGRDCGCNADIPAEDTAEMKKAPDSKPEEKKSGCRCGKDGGEAEEPKKECSKKEEKKLKEENEKLNSSLSELNDKYTRMLAEYDNFRKRAAKERDGIYGDACADILKEVLTVRDSLELAMKYADESELSKGVSMTLAKFDAVLKKLGVEEFGKPGEKFDPNLHNAVLHTEDDSLGENEIAEVMLKGYKKGDRIIRYAMVRVAN